MITSYGNGLRLAELKLQGSYSECGKILSTRYIPEAGIIQSWNANKSKDWECPVIIDNMMNLELLFEATKLSGDSFLSHRCYPCRQYHQEPLPSRLQYLARDRLQQK